MTPQSSSTVGTNALQRRAILVDDDPSLLRLMKSWLSEIGYETDEFAEFEPAKQRLMSSTPHVLITDVRLGAFNGLQLVVLAKLAHPEIVAIVLTGFDDPVLRKAATDAGAVFLAKPLSGAQLVDVVQTYSTAIT
jgi:DNA-binding response OmpR family regulator